MIVDEEDLFGELETHTAGNASSQRLISERAADLREDDEFLEEDEFEGLNGDHSRISI